MTTTVCRDPAAFAALAADWRALHGRCRAATPFQSHSWLHSWWLSYGTPGRLRIVLVRRGGRLVAAAPLMLTYRPLPVLVPLGGAISDFSDVLLDDSCPGPAAAELAAGVHRAARGALVDLREVRPGAAAERLYAAWPGPRRRLADSVTLELPGMPMDDLVGRLAGPRARRVRAKLRRLDALGIEERTVPAGDVPSSVRTMLRLHGLQWQGRGVTPEHLRPRFAAHLARATREMVGSGDAVLTEYRVDGRVMAADILLMSADLAGGYLYGADPELRDRKVDITTMLMRHDARHVVDTGRGALSLLRGTEPYKLHWRPVPVTNQRLLLARRAQAPALGLYAARITCRALAAGLARDRMTSLRGLRTRLGAVPARGTGRP
ncbi:GNAT family N-acetyltransferase [Streptomyces endophytica]|uniref:GNAT family N-acetyltransferase n=1 Tax=Streptomyces endophytica TaxID=2991496 RepID=A0ABY6PD24_9ACTN|nr:GNAT family N-acetyltransferase [Streptomyces endophytica]UZJ31270.1 GNAT family N-acetyltransferase [Streptomyces endophytica]